MIVIPKLRWRIDEIVNLVRGVGLGHIETIGPTKLIGCNQMHSSSTPLRASAGGFV